MDFDKYYKSMFLIAGIWNIGLGLIIMLFYPILFPLMGITMPNSSMWIQATLLLVIVFGVAFIFVSLNPEDNKSIVRIGAIEKIAFFILFYWYATNGSPLTLFVNPILFFTTLNLNILMIAIVDLAFGLLFIEFIVRY